MPLIVARCTNCGGDIQVDSKKDAQICKYCDTAFIVEKAINNYNISNNITASVVNMYGDYSKDFKIRAGVLTEYNGEARDVIIPKAVVEIGENVFCKLRITSVIIPESVIKIETCAFMNCKSLTKIVIPASVNNIGAYAFSGCSKLRDVHMTQKLLNKLKNTAENRCEYLINQGYMTSIEVIIHIHNEIGLGVYFENTLFYEKYIRVILQKIQAERRKKGLCPNCGVKNCQICKK